MDIMTKSSKREKKPMTVEVRDVESDAIIEEVRRISDRMNELMDQHHMGLADRQIVRRAVTSVRYAYMDVDINPSLDMDKGKQWERSIGAARYFVREAAERFSEWPSVTAQINDLCVLMRQLDEHRKTWYEGGDKE